MDKSVDESHVWYTEVMPDPSAFQPDANGSQPTRPVATRSPSHYISVVAAQQRYRDAGFPRTDKAIQRYCKNGTLVKFDEIGPNGRPKFFIDPASITQHLTQLAQLHHLENGDSQDADESRPEATVSDASSSSPIETLDVSNAAVPSERQQFRQVPNTHGDAADKQGADVPPVDDTSRPAPTSSRDGGDPKQGTGNPVRASADLLIYEHPYVKRLERDVDELKQLYKDQIKRTEDIQTEAFDRIVELQRSSQIAQSQTLADFFIKTRDYLLGRSATDAPEDRPAR